MKWKVGGSWILENGNCLQKLLKHQQKNQPYQKKNLLKYVINKINIVAKNKKKIIDDEIKEKNITDKIPIDHLNKLKTQIDTGANICKQILPDIITHSDNIDNLEIIKNFDFDFNFNFSVFSNYNKTTAKEELQKKIKKFKECANTRVQAKKYDESSNVVVTTEIIKQAKEIIENLRKSISIHKNRITIEEYFNCINMDDYIKYLIIFYKITVNTIDVNTIDVNKQTINLGEFKKLVNTQTIHLRPEQKDEKIIHILKIDEYMNLPNKSS